MPIPIVSRVVLPLCVSASAALFGCTVEVEPESEFDDLAADLAEHAGIDDYVVVVEDREPEAPSTTPVGGAELTAEDDPTALMNCWWEGWIGHTDVCRVCEAHIWAGCFRSEDCGSGASYSYC